MNVQFVVCDIVSGAVVSTGFASEYQVAAQAVEGQIAVAVPNGVIAYPDLNLTPLRAALVERVDAAAGLFRSNFITVIPGQELTYLYKASEAKAWTTGDDPLTAPFLASEAAATGAEIDDVAAMVRSQAEAWTALGSKIEGARLGAKANIMNAPHIPAMIAAATVDWPSLI